MTSLSALFGSPPESGDDREQDGDKLLNLYWNRAELKKAFATLRDEKHDLAGRLKEQEGRAARVQQKLDHLENLLLDPEWVYNVVTHFQLLGLHRRCSKRLARFAEELKQKREKKLHSQRIEEWNEQRDLEATAIEAEIGSRRLAVQSIELELDTMRERLDSMNGVVRIFRKRKLQADVDELARALEAARAREQALLERYDSIQNRQPPDAEGLDIATKRMINFMIIAFAQHLYLDFRDDDLAPLARDAADKSVGAINFGGKDECDAILARVGRKLRDWDDAAIFADTLRQRARLIAEKALFANPDDAVPRPGTVATVFEIEPSGRVCEEKVDLLGRNFWNLDRVLSR